MIGNLLRFIPGPRDRLWALLGCLGASVALYSAAYIQEFTYLNLSRQPPPHSAGDSSSLWGGRTKASEQPERALFDNDSYYWVRYAQQMVAGKTPRLRYTFLDNTPDGREVHWSSGYSWAIIAAGFIHGLFTGRTTIGAIPDAAVWVNTALFACVLFALAWAIYRRAGGLAAGAVVLTLSILPGITWAFAYGRPGHHGIHSLAALGGMACLILGGLGWTRKSGGKVTAHLATMMSSPSFIEARGWFIAAGIFSGIGFWVGATLQAIVVASIGLGAFRVSQAAAIGTQKDSDPEWRGDLWLLWGISGAVTSLLFFLIEYFPNRLFAMRLEVNHPMYALALLGGAAFLFKARDFWSVEGWRKSWQWFLVCALLVSAAPVAVLFGPVEWHSLRDPYMRRLHDSIMNFQPLLQLPGQSWQMRLFREFGFIPLAIPVFLWISVFGNIGVYLKSAMCFILPPMLILGAWTFYQVRWSNLFTPALGMALLVSIWWVWDSWQTSHWPGRLARMTLPLAGVLPVWGWFAYTNAMDLPKVRDVKVPDGMLARAMATRDVALQLRRYGKNIPLRVMSAPTEAPSLHYFGGAQGTGSLYWENIPGVHDSADFFGDYGEDEALEIVRRRSINFVVIQEDAGAAMEACWIKHESKEEKDVMKTLAFRLSAPGLHKIPKWLEPIPFYSSPAAQFFRMRLYRVRWEEITPISSTSREKFPALARALLAPPVTRF